MEPCLCRLFGAGNPDLGLREQGGDPGGILLAVAERRLKDRSVGSQADPDDWMQRVVKPCCDDTSFLPIFESDIGANRVDGQNRDEVQCAALIEKSMIPINGGQRPHSTPTIRKPVNIGAGRREDSDRGIEILPT